MANMNWVNNIVEEKLMMLNTCFLAKVISTDGEKAKVLPLGKRKQYGEEAVEQTPLTVPIANSAKYKYTKKTIYYMTNVTLRTTTKNFAVDVDGGEDSPAYVSSSAPALTSVQRLNTKDSEDIVSVKPLEAGDIVVCVCADRNITAALKGENSVPPVGHHSQSDAIIIGII